jgi:hypothetical protein
MAALPPEGGVPPSSQAEISGAVSSCDRFYAAALHVRFRRLTLRPATGTAQRAIPTAGRVAAAWPFYVEISHFTYVGGDKPNAAGSLAEFVTRLMRFGKPCSLGRRDLE